MRTGRGELVRIGTSPALVPLQSPSRTGLSPNRRDTSADHLAQRMLFSHWHRKALSYFLFFNFHSYSILSYLMR
jgi:hypothetical protein